MQQNVPSVAMEFNLFLRGDDGTFGHQPYKMPADWTFDKFCFSFQAKLEKLLQIYPQEEIESKRWEKIAAALGNRTYKQVLLQFFILL